MTQESEKYSIEQHKHIFASWAASRAASVRPSKNSKLPIKSFTVQEGLEVLEEIGFTKDFKLESLPKSQEEFDNEHAKWCDKAISKFESFEDKKKSSEDRFSYGVAAKLINCYLKVRFVCGGDHNLERVNFVHPPIDSLLLTSLVKDSSDFKKFYKELKSKAWSNFEKSHYTSVINKIKEIDDLEYLGHKESLWKIEYYWQGHR